MNTRQNKGTVKNLAAEAQQAAGKGLEHKGMQAKGLRRQVAGITKKATRDANQGIKDFIETLQQPAGKH